MPLANDSHLPSGAHLTAPDGFSLVGHVVYKLDVPVAVVHPSTLLAEDLGDDARLLGPAGAVRVAVSEPLFPALLRCGALLLGTPESVLEVNRLLLSECDSRNVTYLCSICPSCDDVVRFRDSIMDSSVAIVGCGGIGSTAAMLLVGAGVRSLVLVDPDVVEIGNFNRQLFWRISDIGAAKVHVLRDRIAERFPAVKVETICETITPKSFDDVAKRVNGVLASADEPIGLAEDLRRIARQYEIVFVSGGYYFGEATVSGYSPTSSSISPRFFPIGKFIAPSFSTVNASVAASAASSLLLSLGRLRQPLDSIVTWRLDETSLVAF